MQKIEEFIEKELSFSGSKYLSGSIDFKISKASRSSTIGYNLEVKLGVSIDKLDHQNYLFGVLKIPIAEQIIRENKEFRLSSEKKTNNIKVEIINKNKFEKFRVLLGNVPDTSFLVVSLNFEQRVIDYSFPVSSDYLDKLNLIAKPFLKVNRELKEAIDSENLFYIESKNPKMRIFP